MSQPSVVTHLLMDGGMIRHHQTDRMRLIATPAQKDAGTGVMLREEFFDDPGRRWEARFDNGYPTVLRDPGTGLLRLYYTLFIVDPSATSTSLDRRPHETYRPSSERVVAFAVAESTDGVTWAKPELGLVEFDGDTANNLIMLRAHGTGIMLDLEDPDPNRRYKMVTRIDVPTGRAFGTAFSADGIHFGPVTPWAGPVPLADTHNAPFRDPATGMYGITTRVWKDGVRICALSTSPDFIHWSEPVEILRGQAPYHQIYSMPVFTHHGQFIGLPALYHEGDRSADDFDLVETELATAHALDSWQQVAPGNPLIDRGPGRYPDGAFDAGCVYAACPIEIDGTTWIYYFGSNGRHTGFREASLGRARVDLDRLAGYRPIDNALDGRLVVGPFLLTTDDVEVLADIDADGELSWRLVDPDGRVPNGIPDELHTIAPGSGWHALPLGPAIAAWAGREACLQFTARRAQLFAVRTSCEHRRFG